MRYQGLVTKELVSQGSKSEHRAVVLRTTEGPMKLRRVGGNPFNDPELNRLVGQKISCEGQEHAGQLLITSYEVLGSGEDA
jgi:hypothetical protein